MLNKKDLARKLARRTFLNNKESELVLGEIFEIIVEAIKSGEEVSVVGFGKFYLYEHAPRPVRNPKTQQEMILKSYKSLRFKSSDVIKNILKSKTSLLENEDGVEIAEAEETEEE